MSWIRRNLKVLLPLTAVAAVGIAYLAVGVFGVQTLFIDDRVDDSGPVFASGAGAATTPAPSASPSVPPSVPPSVSPADAPAPAPSTPVVPDAVPATTEPTPAPTTVAPEPQITTLVQGTFIPRGRYSGEGTAVVLTDGSEQRFLRFENFSTDNGPDLNVYLVASDANADTSTFDDDFIDLGDLRGNIGDQNYEIPPGVDLSVYDTVVVWCVRFASAFTAADLAAA